MTDSVSLTSSMRANLLALQSTSKMMDITQERLSTGKKVNSAIDNPSNYFAALAHTDRANQLMARKDAMNEALNTLKSSVKTVDAIKSVIENLRGVISAARSTDGGATAAQVTQFTELKSQLDTLVDDSTYKGVNFLDGDSLDVLFNEDGSSKLAITGTASKSSDLSIGSLVAADEGATLDTLEGTLNDAINTLKDTAAGLASNSSIISTRIAFTDNLVSIEKDGAAKLTEADMNEESANMLMLQTRQQLGTTALSLASQAAQGVLRLF